jgi:hypothetical protein
MGWGEPHRPNETDDIDVHAIDVHHLAAEHRAACEEIKRLRASLTDAYNDPAGVPDPPRDRSDLVVMGHWVADCLDATNHLVWRTIVRRMATELESLRGER